MQRLLLTSLLVGIAAPAQTILVRDIDRRPLPTVPLQHVSPAMQHAVQAILDDQMTLFADRNTNGSNPVKPEFLLERIPVAPAGHHLYTLSLSGEFGCTGNGPNCRQVIFDETAVGVETVDDDSGVGIAVVRRPNLQLPDIARYEQEGHFATDTTVFRFDGTSWKPYRCSSVAITDFPPPRIVANQPCTP